MPGLFALLAARSMFDVFLELIFLHFTTKNSPKDAFWIFSGRFEGVLERLECALGHLRGI